jgi:hypothetical protein
MAVPACVPGEESGHGVMPGLARRTAGDAALVVDRYLVGRPAPAAPGSMRGTQPDHPLQPAVCRRVSATRSSLQEDAGARHAVFHPHRRLPRGARRIRRRPGWATVRATVAAAVRAAVGPTVPGRRSRRGKRPARRGWATTLRPPDKSFPARVSLVGESAVVPTAGQAIAAGRPAGGQGNGAPQALRSVQ